MAPWVDLSRSFRDLANVELDADDGGLSVRYLGLRPRVSWPEILKHPRVALLAGAGAGKTSEMRMQAAQLRAEGQAAAFIPLEILDRLELIAAAEPEDEDAIEAWLANKRGRLTLFLDAVDELKLGQGSLGAAMRKVRAVFRNSLDEIAVVVSCRPSDWRPESDLDAFRLLAPPTRTIATFVDHARSAEGPDGRLTHISNKKTALETFEPRFFGLRPLDVDDIRKLLIAHDVPDGEALILRLNETDALDRIARPLDALRVIDGWKRTGTLLTRTGQMEAEVEAAVNAIPKVPGSEGAPPAVLRKAAERIAFAVVTSGRQHVRVPEGEAGADEAHEAAAILSTFDSAQVGILLRSSLFDPATYGRVKFRHRSMAEYLAAQHLLRRLCAGPRRAQIDRLLFPTVYGHRVVPRYLQALTAWLALWDRQTFDRVIAVMPELLLVGGDPEGFPLQQREALLDAITSTYGNGTWRGIDAPRSEIMRLADPQLSGAVRRMWSRRGSNAEIEELLLRVMREGRMCDCVDILSSAVWNTSVSPYGRIVAMHALADCIERDELAPIAQAMIDTPEDWPARIVVATLDTLYPSVVDEAGLSRLVERAQMSGDLVSLRIRLREIAQTINPVSVPAERLLQEMVALLARETDDSRDLVRRSAFPDVAEMVATLCLRRLAADGSPAPAPVIEAYLLLAELDRYNHYSDEHAKSLAKRLRGNPLDRRALLLGGLDRAKAVAKESHALAFRADAYSIPIIAEDTPWFLDQVASQDDPLLREALALILVRSTPGEDRDALFWGRLKNAVNDDESLTERLDQWRTPPSCDEENTERERRWREAQETTARKQAARAASWDDFHSEIQSRPAEMFSASIASNTLYNLFNDQRRRNEQSADGYVFFDHSKLTSLYGSEVAEAAKAALRQRWRAIRADVEATPSQPNTTTWNEIVALNGLVAEAEAAGWASALTGVEFDFAVRMAQTQLNGLPAFLDDLVAHNPVRAASVVAGQIRVELQRENDGRSHARWTQDVAYNGKALAKAVAPSARHFIIEGHADGARAEVVGQLGRILRADAEKSTTSFVDAVARLVQTARDPATAGAWFAILTSVAPERAADILDEFALDTAEARNYVAALLAQAFDRHGGRGDIDTLPNSPEIARRLVSVAYRAIQPADDVRREGTYTPDARDRAEDVRNTLLGHIMNLAGPKAAESMLELAADPALSHLRDRLPYLVKARAADDASLLWTLEDLRAFDAESTVAPRTHDEMLSMMLASITDVEHDLHHNDFSMLDALRRAPNETDQQIILGDRLDRAVGRLVTIHREEEVADEKKPDIRLATPGLSGAIEIKIADRWSTAELRSALEDQLVGQYLRHDRCRSGILLLTYTGAKGSWRCDGKSIGFNELVEWLSGIAEQLHHKRPELRLAVVGIDLR